MGGGEGATKKITTLAPRPKKRKPGSYRNVAAQTPVNTYFKGEKFWERYKKQKGDEAKMEEAMSSGSEREAEIEDEYSFKQEKLERKKRDALKKIERAVIEVTKEKKCAEIALETGLSLEEVARKMEEDAKHAEEEARIQAEIARKKAEEEEAKRLAAEEAERARLNDLKEKGSH